jgi:hypothetical protein
MNKDFFKLTEETGISSEFYSDDEAANQLADQVRSELTQAQTNSSNFGVDQSYDDLFNSI